MKLSENSNGSDGSVHEMDGETKAILETELKSWSASSAEQIKEAENVREYKFSTPPDWKCIICKESIKRNLVYQSGKTCRKCSKAISRIRQPNLAVEDIMKSLVVTCKFANLGCEEVIKYRDMETSKHEENCSLAPMVCPMPSCSQAGVKNLLAQHLLSKHEISFMVDVVQLARYRSYEYKLFEYSGISKEFELDSSSTSVMVRHMDSKEFHLLHQESTTLGYKLKITSLAKSRKRKYELDVTINNEHTYCLKSVSTSNMQQGGELVIPKQPGDGTLKKRCTIYMAT